MLDITEVQVDQQVVDNLYSIGHVTYVVEGIPVNGYMVFRSKINSQSTALARHQGNHLFVRLQSPKHLTVNGITPRDSRQTAFLDALSNSNTLVNVAIGTAGTGKTTIAIAYAASRFLEEGAPILLAKPAVMVGRAEAFGPVPGTIDEKYDPYLGSYKIVLKKIFGQTSDQYFEKMKDKGDLQFIPIEMARGCTFENCTFILDEAQNLDWHELNTIVSRMGQNTKLIVLGDMKQIDTKQPIKETGLYKLISSYAFQQSPIGSAIELLTQYRSPITRLVADVDEELRTNGR